MNNLKHDVECGVVDLKGDSDDDDDDECGVDDLEGDSDDYDDDECGVHEDNYDYYFNEYV
jgi:hypothetical protein